MAGLKPRPFKTEGRLGILKGRGFNRAEYGSEQVGALAPEGRTLRPSRESTRQAGQSYFVSTQTAARQPLFRHERWALLMLNVLVSYRTDYLLHDYVLMPDHMHLLLTPNDAIERSMQIIKGGFSYRAKRELRWNGEIWQKGFTDHRIREWEDWSRYAQYIRMNPVRAKLCEKPDDYPYGSAMGSLLMDAVPQRLKPPASCEVNGGAEAPPLHGASTTDEAPN
jgi:putative transposase